MERSSIRQSSFAVLAALIWGTTFVAQSVGAEYVPALAFNAARSIIAFVFLLVLCLILRQVRRSSGKPATATRSLKDLLRPLGYEPNELPTAPPRDVITN